MDLPKRRFRLRHAVIGVAATLLLGVVALEVAGWPFLRQPIERAMTRATAVPSTLQGPFKLHLFWRPRLEVDHLNIGSDPRFEVPHLLDARQVVLAWRWGDVWRWRQGEPLRVHALQAETLDAHLLRTPDGQANWQLGDQSQSKEPDPDGFDLPRFGTLMVGRGKIDWRDAVQDVDLDIAVRGSEGEAVSQQGAGYEATVNGRYQAMAMKLAVKAGGTLPLLQDPDASAQAPWVPVRVEGTVASSRLLFDGEAAALLGTPRLRGALELKGPSLAAVGEPLGITLPTTPPFDLKGNLQHEGGQWRLQASRANIGSSRLAGDLLFDQTVSPARLSGEVNGSRLAFADLGPAVGADGAGDQPAQRQPEGRVLPQRKFDLPSLKAMDADVRMKFDELDFGTASMAPLRQLQTRLRLDGGVLRLESLQTVVAGGSLKGLTQLDANASPAKWEADLDFAGIDVAGWLRGLQKDSATEKPPAATATTALKRERNEARQGGDQPVQSYLTGALSGNVKVTGAGNSTAAILGSLNGPMQINLRDGTVSYLVTEAMGLDVAQALGVVISGDKPLPLRCARFDLVARNGVIEPRLAVADNADSTIWVTGPINLKDESLDLRVVTRPKDWSPLSLRTPITVGGTLGNPDVGIEAQGLVGRVLGALALGATVGPLAALIPLIEQGSKEGADPCNPTLAAAPARKP
ncbi:AsmA family protein [Hydrogenophaga sp.]|uniref:AsmA family protein n=1 Tax=Hydrogenophaga sp. TaxID=1904254 RepID=UPI003F6EEE49